MVNSRLMSRHPACYQDGKPFFIGEAGIIANNSAGFATRASQFDARLKYALNHGVVAYLFWSFDGASAK
jgi:hypothetical protein